MNLFQLTFLTRLFFTGTVLTGICIAFLIANHAYSNRIDPSNSATPTNEKPAQTNSSKIQLAILLDTSNSMDGLINQTREQLWQMVDELSKAKRFGKSPTLEVAVYEYGNDSIAASVGHVRQVQSLTTDLDRVSEALFSLSTNGGQEYCGYAINTAIEQLEWSASAEDLKLIFIAGNEPFTQGPINYAHAIQLAKQHDVAVSTIFAGNHEEGVGTGWQQGAVLAGGNFMSIDHNANIAHIAAPQDDKIAKLNNQLNQTYIPFGKEGEESKARQIKQDSNSESVSSAYLAKRAKAKASHVYKNTNWDLVDAVTDGKVALEKLEHDELPATMKDMDMEEQENFIANKKAERKALKQQIIVLSEQREIYIAEQQDQAQGQNTSTVNTAIMSAIEDQAKKKQYTIGE